MIAVFSSDRYFETVYQSLKGAGIEIDFLVTEHEKPSGRGQIMTKNPAHLFAKSVNLEVKTYESLDQDSYLNLKALIKEKNTRLGFVFSYGKIIPERFISLFDLGVINVHFSILPKYRGAAPLQASLLNGDSKTGLSFFLIDKGLDTGKILQQIEFDISPNEDFDSLKQRALQITAKSLPELLSGYIGGKIKAYEQSKEGLSFAREIKKADGLITPRDTALKAYNKIRAYSTWPKAYLKLNEKRVIIHKARLENDRLVIETIQVEGKKPIAFDDFKKGYSHLLTYFPKFVKI